MNYIYELGKERILNDDIRNMRYVYNIKDKIDNDQMIEMIINIAINEIKDKKNINLYEYSNRIIQRTNDIGFSMNWHIDDCSVYKHKQIFEPNQPKIKNKYTIFHMEPLPKYSMIIYLTDNFIGGEFEFIDQLIKPKKYDVIFFDSREVHRVRKLRQGIRQNILIKFYIF